jgi:hypothetical protein
MLDILEAFDTVFLVGFTLELSLKLIAYKFKYFEDGWNNFELGMLSSSYTLMTVDNVFLKGRYNLIG